MGAAYPDLLERREFILRVMGLEEERFGETYERGIAVLNGMIRYRSRHKGAISEVIEFAKWRNPGAENAAGVLEQYGFIGYDAEAPSEVQHGEETAAALASELAYSAFSELEEGEYSEADISFGLLTNWGQTISGGEAFYLYDTFGFRWSSLRRYPQNTAMRWDVEAFEHQMEAQRQRAQASAERFGGEFDAMRVYQELGVEETRFLGYETLETRSVIVRHGGGRHSRGARRRRPAGGGRPERNAILRRAGRAGRGYGTITAGDSVMEVEDTRSPIAGRTVHRCRVTSGSFTIGDSVDARIDARRRASIARNHTATHLLHATLRRVLGFHVRQHGSLVAPDRLRFDFTHVSPLTREELLEVQRLANEKIRENVAVHWHETTYREAVADGALAFFGDRYGDRVRVVEVANGAAYSVEVCGGDARASNRRHRLLPRCVRDGDRLRAAPHRGGDRQHRRGAHARAGGSAGERGRACWRARLESSCLVSRGCYPSFAVQTGARIPWSVSSCADRSGSCLEARLRVYRWSRGVLTVSNVDFLREAGDWLRNDIGSGIVILGAVIEGRPAMMAMATRDVAESGFDAGGLVREAAKAMGGGGGGRRGPGPGRRTLPGQAAGCHPRCRRGRASLAGGAVLRLLGLDVGASRIGAAISDPTGILVSPLAAVRRTRLDNDLEAIAGLVREHDVASIVVGLPLSLSGGLGPQGRAVRGLYPGAVRELRGPRTRPGRAVLHRGGRETAPGGGTLAVKEQGAAGLRGRVRDTAGVPGRAGRLAAMGRFILPLLS